MKKIHFLLFAFVFGIQTLSAKPLVEQFKEIGYQEICDLNHGTKDFDSLYSVFDQFVEFLQENPGWVQKLYLVKERFIRSKDQNYYSTDFFGFYDESKKEGRKQISFYYSIHFHEYLCSHYPEFNHIPQIIHFLKACCEIQKPYAPIFAQAAVELNLPALFSSSHDQPPILLKVVKYLADYTPTKPHYDGTAFSLFLDSTDNLSLLLTPYKASLTIDDFYSPSREFERESAQRSLLLIPGTLLTQFSIYPTPHIVISSGKVRYATIAFAMRPHYKAQKNELAALPNFKY